MIKLTRTNGDPIWVKKTSISTFYMVQVGNPPKDGTRIELNSGIIHNVQEPFNVVHGKLARINTIATLETK